MAKLRMTYKNLKALRKSREYQALLVDLVNVGVVPKATAEGLLGYNIPANLITDDESSGTDDPINEGTEGSGTVTLLYYAAAKGGFVWQTKTFTLANDTTEADIIAAAKTAFADSTIDTISFVQLNPEYVEGESELSAKYTALDPQPEAFANGQLIICETAETEEGSGPEGN